MNLSPKNSPKIGDNTQDSKKGLEEGVESRINVDETKMVREASQGKGRNENRNCLLLDEFITHRSFLSSSHK